MRTTHQAHLAHPARVRGFAPVRLVAKGRGLVRSHSDAKRILRGPAPVGASGPLCLALADAKSAGRPTAGTAGQPHSTMRMPCQAPEANQARLWQAYPGTPGSNRQG
jgi:hypothetical protein